MDSLRKTKCLESEFSLPPVSWAFCTSYDDYLGGDVDSPPRLNERLNREKIQEKTLIEKNPTPK